MGPAKENNYALESLDRCIVSGTGELKRKFPLNDLATNFGAAKLQSEGVIIDWTVPGLGERAFREGINVRASNWRRNGYSFVPLVTEDFCLRCSIDILFLRPEEPGRLIKSGDIDGRLKTVFDALRMPNNLEEAGGLGPQEDEEPFYVLLEDDKLIADVSVTTDKLLVLPKERELNPNDTFLVIHAKIQPTYPTANSWVFSL
jgi:hypothetical protein